MNAKTNASANVRTSPVSDTRELAEYVEEVSGGLISNALGLVSDRLAYLRLKQAFSLRDKVREELLKRGVKQPKEVFPKVLIPLLENATLEENEELHSRYALLLANAQDPKYRGEIKRSYVSILGELEPIDLLILDSAFTTMASNHTQLLADLTQVAFSLRIRRKHAAISVRNLIRLGIFRPGVVVANGVTYDGHALSSYKDIDQFGLTELGIAFVEAMRPPTRTGN